jgi:hypothetical protein
MHPFSGTAATICLAMTMVPASAASGLIGLWGGDQAQLTLDASGGRIEYDCGAGTIDAPVIPDSSGTFSLRGKHEGFLSRPTAMDTMASDAAYRGVIRGERMTLTVQIAGEKSERVYVLVRGQRVKLKRCL